MEKIISSSKEFQQEILLRLELLTTAKIHSLQGKAVSYEDVIELDIMNTLSSNLSTVFDLTTEEVPFEIISAWAMVKVHKELLNLYITQNRLSDEKYNDVLDNIANKIFLGLFVAH